MELDIQRPLTATLISVETYSAEEGRLYIVGQWEASECNFSNCWRLTLQTPHQQKPECLKVTINYTFKSIGAMGEQVLQPMPEWGGGVILQDTSKVSDDGEGKPTTCLMSLTTSAVIQLLNF